MNKNRNAGELITAGNAVLGIEFGSTRIKAVLIDEDHTPIASGNYEWENRYEFGVWTYRLEDIWCGLKACYRNLLADVKNKYNVTVSKVGAIGISAMMHGYMPFNEKGELLVPFRTWRNTITSQAADELTALFQYNIPQRWSIAHLRQAMLNGEEHVGEINYITTLAGYIHWRLTGQKVLGIGDASGMFPIDIKTKNYDMGMLHKFNDLKTQFEYNWRLEAILPKILTAGESAGTLTAEGAKLLDDTGALEPGIPLCAPEGDAGTGMTATNSISKRTGNVSAGTSVFAMIVLEKELSRAYSEIDLVTTPTGNLVGMVHCNNCTSDLNAWVSIFKEYSELMGMNHDMNDIYGALYRHALKGDKDCGGLLSYCYFSGEHIMGFEEGRPLFARTQESAFNLANFMRVHLFTALGALKVGADILFKEENVELEQLLGHGGFFKTEKVGQQVMAAAMNVPVTVMETAGEGGAWGIALLASYMLQKEQNESLDEYLVKHVFNDNCGNRIAPDEDDVEGFEQFMKRYKAGVSIEQAAVDALR